LPLAAVFDPAAGPRRRSFEQGFLKDIATKLDINPARISILAVTWGSIVVHFAVAPGVRGETNPDEVMEVLQAQQENDSLGDLGGAPVTGFVPVPVRHPGSAAPSRLFPSGPAPRAQRAARPRRRPRVCSGVEPRVRVQVAARGPAFGARAADNLAIQFQILPGGRADPAPADVERELRQQLVPRAPPVSWSFNIHATLVRLRGVCI
jgi:hypothetical protein